MTVEGDVDGNGGGDFPIEIAGTFTLLATDFLGAGSSARPVWTDQSLAFEGAAIV